MIFDQENMFFDKASSGATSNVIANVGGGDASDPLFITAHVDTPQTDELTLTLQTATDSSFTTPIDMASYKVPVGGVGLVLSAKMPYGAKDFLRLTLSAGTGSLAGMDTINFDLMSMNELRIMLYEKGIEYRDDATRAELVELIKKNS
ncbi:unnamed protein product [Cylicocyclus nassatus]|uniref:Uncharacterized protein n=1 Tax=Cylicocyclus nassatus TaxID=53992 RepID=A0AA36GYI2_CYLNA|nr:unnamed protein product [Cylicocyclus nassatus]